MASLPQGVRCVFQEWSGEFCETVWPRVRVLMLAAIVCVGRHTICRLLRIPYRSRCGSDEFRHRLMRE